MRHSVTRALGAVMVLVATVAASGCAAMTEEGARDPAATAVEEPEPTLEETEAPPEESEPDAGSAPGANLVDGVVGDTLRWESYDGYIAEVGVEWFPVRDYEPQDLPEVCVQILSELHPGLTNPRYVGIPVLVTVSYPEVNGFVWPSGSGAAYELNYGISAGINRLYNCNVTSPPPYSPEALKTRLLSPPGGTVEYIGLDVVSRTPNNPEGEPEWTLSDISYGGEYKGAAGKCLNVVDEDLFCESPHPGGR